MLVHCKAQEKALFKCHAVINLAGFDCNVQNFSKLDPFLDPFCLEKAENTLAQGCAADLCGCVPVEGIVEFLDCVGLYWGVTIQRQSEKMTLL